MTLALVVEDDHRVRLLVRTALGAANVDVVEADDVGSAADLLRRMPVDVALIDPGLPSGSGLDLLPMIRAVDPTIHVIVVSGASGEGDRVRGLRQGADDYVVKPFSVAELVARVEAGQRRRTSAWTTPVELGPLRIDRGARQVTFRGRPVALTRRELDLLHHLASYAGRAFSRDELLRTVWGSSSAWQSPSTVTEHVRRLRVKLEDDAGRPRLLVTVPGVGYRLDPQALRP